MKSTSALLLISFGLLSILLICLLLDFLALHDIRNDYVSYSVIDQFAANSRKALPLWSGTSSEWAFVHVSYLIKLIVAGLSIITLGILRRKIRLMQ